MSIAERIKKYRSDKRYTQKELAALLNVKPTTVSGWELGRNTPSIEMIKKLASIFGVSFDNMAGVSDNNNKLKTADLADKDTVFTYEGRQIPPEDLEYMKRLLRGGKQ